jgi:hypothetical protein
MSPQSRAALTTIVALVACSDRKTGNEDEANEIMPTQPLDVAVPESESEGEVICREDLLACNGECVDPSTNNDHCGVCNHQCFEPVFYGACEDATCPSARRCVGSELGLRTCNEVCAHHGQTCDEGPRVLSRGCGGSHQFNFGLGALERCEKLGGEAGVEATCDDLIDWSYKGGLTHEPARAVSCCCTQEPPP